VCVWYVCVLLMIEFKVSHLLGEHLSHAYFPWAGLRL
jgi:hypothetical protein